MIEKIPFHYTDKITVVNREQFEAHMRLYEGYVTNINKVDEALSSRESAPESEKANFREQANTTFSYYRECKRGETYALNGVILHELYFSNIGGDGKGPKEVTIKHLNSDFKSFDNWRDDFIATAKASRGWAVLCFDQRSHRFRNISLDLHDLGNIAYSAPALVLDMYEHAYFLQYADNKNEYINKFMDNINWEEVGDRMNF